jgi:hypothetical protein
MELMAPSRHEAGEDDDQGTGERREDVEGDQIVAINPVAGIALAVTGARGGRGGLGWVATASILYSVVAGAGPPSPRAHTTPLLVPVSRCRDAPCGRMGANSRPCARHQPFAIERRRRDPPAKPIED